MIIILLFQPTGVVNRGYSIDYYQKKIKKTQPQPNSTKNINEKNKNNLPTRRQRRRLGPAPAKQTEILQSQCPNSGMQLYKTISQCPNMGTI